MEFSDTDGSGAILRGLTLRNGGYGVYYGYDSDENPTVNQCKITANYTGVECRGDVASIENNIIFDNGYNGVFCSGSAAPNIQNNMILGTRHSSGFGAGILLCHANSTDILILNNTIVDNDRGIWADEYSSDPNFTDANELDVNGLPRFFVGERGWD